MEWFDAHCHLANMAKIYDFTTCFKQAEEKGIKGWFSNALNKEEVRWHQLHRSDKILWSAGIHPYYIEGSQLTLEELDKLATDKQIFAIGEIGLDKRAPNLDNQIKLFKDQLSLAKSHNLPCVFHIVGQTDIFFRILSDLPVTGIWHGFSGSSETVKQFAKFGLTFSFGHVLINALKNEVINSIIDYGNYLLETDAPYNLNKPDTNADFNLNPLYELLNYSRVVSRLNGVKLESLLLDLEVNTRQFTG